MINYSSYFVPPVVDIGGRGSSFGHTMFLLSVVLATSDYCIVGRYCAALLSCRLLFPTLRDHLFGLVPDIVRWQNACAPYTCRFRCSILIPHISQNDRRIALPPISLVCTSLIFLFCAILLFCVYWASQILHTSPPLPDICYCHRVVLSVRNHCVAITTLSLVSVRRLFVFFLFVWMYVWAPIRLLCYQVAGCFGFILWGCSFMSFSLSPANWRARMSLVNSFVLFILIVATSTSSVVFIALTHNRVIF